MCTIKTEHSAMVCDVALGRIRTVLADAFGDSVRYVNIYGEGTLVEVPPVSPPGEFEKLVQIAMARAAAAEQAGSGQ